MACILLACANSSLSWQVKSPSLQPMTILRRSARLQRLFSADPLNHNAFNGQKKSLSQKKKVPVVVKKALPSGTGDETGKTLKTTKTTLPRTREMEILQNHSNISFIMGVDEAGRGPLAGPVVAAAILSTCATIDGICDSKVLTKESLRDELHQRLVSSPNIRYAIAVVDARTIDQINILQATYEAMRMAAGGVLGVENLPYKASLSNIHEGNYVVTGATDQSGNPNKNVLPIDPKSVMSLIDGNRLPPEFPTKAEVMIKGDGREYLIGAASILAKVSRDTLMHQYHEQYPHFLLNQHKGYPTAKHMALVAQHGPLPIHRLTFSPLKTLYPDSSKKNDGSMVKKSSQTNEGAAKEFSVIETE